MRLTALALSFGLIAAATAAPLSIANAATAELKGADGKALGTATLTDAPHGVLLRIEAKGLTPGWHGLHFHEKGDCGAPDFKSAGAHVHTTTAVVHGLLNPDGNDNGDLPNLFVAADGSATTELFSPLVSLNGAGGRPPCSTPTARPSSSTPAPTTTRPSRSAEPARGWRAGW
jgi:Cu-Zn family superoxide dismutase